MTNVTIAVETKKEALLTNPQALARNSIAPVDLLDNLAYLHGKPTVKGHYKQQYEDFKVQEDLGFSLTGEGEHIFVYLQKRDCNTVFVAEQLAKYVGISGKQVSYAGLKDRHAVTEQWFSLHMPGQETPNFSDFVLAGCQILQVMRHNKKLKIGALKGNHFTLCLREISDRNQIEKRLSLIASEGVPNYFGEQRFGRDGNNIEQVMKWANGEIKVKDRKKRSFYLSAARSVIFNQIVSQRITAGLYKSLLNGDILQLAGLGSWFVAESHELLELQQRLEQGEITLTAPMVGDSPLGTKAESLAFEESCLQVWQNVCKLLKKERVETARRTMLLSPQQLSWQWQDDNSIEVKFYLPAGSYATSLLRELMVCNSD